MASNNELSINSMEQESEDIEAIYTEYIQSKTNLNNVYCFFEGHDYQYYCPRIRFYLNDTEKVKVFDCNGKKNVLSLYFMIKDRTKSNDTKKLFFIDRDFDKVNIENRDIYVTPYYAIENFYITDRVIEDFFVAELGLDETCNDIDKIDFKKGINYYKTERDNYIQGISLLNAWYSLQKNLSSLNKDGKVADLKNLKELKEIKFPITIDFLKDSTPNYIEVTTLELEKEKSRLLKDPLKSFRGKYFLPFLYNVLKTLTGEEAKNKGIFYKKRKVSLTIGKTNIISQLSQYAETPKCLNEYLKSILLDQSNSIINIDNLA